MIEEPSGDSWSLWGWAQTFKVIFNRMNSVSEWIWKRICTLVTCVGVRYLNQHSQESIHQDVLPKKWDVDTRKLIIIKAFVTLGKPKANNRENVLGSVLCAFSVLPRFHPFGQVFSETPPPEPFCSPPRGLLTHLLPQRRVTRTPVLPRFRRRKTELFISRYTSTQALEHSRRVGNAELMWIFSSK